MRHAHLYLFLELRCVLRGAAVSVLLDCEPQRLEARRRVHPIEQSPHSEEKVATLKYKTMYLPLNNVHLETLT